MKKATLQKLTSFLILFMLIAVYTFAQKYVLLELPKGKFGPVFDASTKSSAAADPIYVFGDALNGSVRAYSVFDTSDPSSVFPFYTSITICRHLWECR